MDQQEAVKRRRLEAMFVAPIGGMQRTPEEIKEAYDAAVVAHPFVDLSEHRIEVADNAVFADGEGNVVGMLIRNGIPATAAAMASDVLRTAASRTSLRTSIFGGEAPLSGIAGYYDYSGSPVDLKCRKTCFTSRVTKQWPNVFPLVEYVSKLYQAATPTEWAAQNNAIPDVVRLNDSPFSTLTINQRFRTARHTDAGDFDAGYGVLAVLEGDFEGLHLGLADFRVCFHMQPRDVLIFDTHHFHANTELERFTYNLDWSRLTCVFYYRASLGESNCIKNYQRRLEAAKKIPAADRAVKDLPDRIVAKDNGENHNRPAPVYPVFHTPFILAASLIGETAHWTTIMGKLHGLIAHRPNGERGSGPSDTREQVAFIVSLFGEESMAPLVDGLYPRSASEKADQDLSVVMRTVPVLGGFSEASGAVDVASKNRGLLEEGSLKDALGGETELWRMWAEARGKWLQLVKRDWDHAVELNPERTDFSWKNKSDMNTAFFDLCDVGKNVMLQLLEKEEASRIEENAFWLCFAGHLYHACEDELHMVKDAMSMKKLNVKLKDYNFGGTRYFVDMPKEEQERRLERRKKIEQARRNVQVAEKEYDANWLENDDFDYQSEAAPVPYEQNGWDTPAANAQRFIPATAAHHVEIVRESIKSSIAIRIVVLYPATQNGCNVPPTSPAMQQEPEFQRLMSNRAAQRSLNGDTPPAVSVDAKAAWEAFPGVSVRFVASDEFMSSPPQPCDLVVLRHCLCFLDDKASSELIKRALLCGTLMISESVVSCRSEYCLPKTTLDNYNAAAAVAFPLLLARWVPSLPPMCSKSAVATPFPRRKAAVRECIERAEAALCGLYHFPHSPRNTSVWVVKKKA